MKNLGMNSLINKETLGINYFLKNTEILNTPRMTWFFEWHNM